MSYASPLSISLYGGLLIRADTPAIVGRIGTSPPSGERVVPASTVASSTARMVFGRRVEVSICRPASDVAIARASSSAATTGITCHAADNRRTPQLRNHISACRINPLRGSRAARSRAIPIRVLQIWGSSRPPRPLCDRLICARICARDTPGRLETRKTQKLVGTSPQPSAELNPANRDSPRRWRRASYGS
jgi:hypothetical protein